MKKSKLNSNHHSGTSLISCERPLFVEVDVKWSDNSDFHAEGDGYLALSGKKSGEGGIRTFGTLRYAAFRVQCIHPDSVTF